MSEARGDNKHLARKYNEVSDQLEAVYHFDATHDGWVSELQKNLENAVQDVKRLRKENHE